MQHGTDRSFTLHLENQAMGLLSGTVQSEAPWLALGEPPGVSSKVFQCRHDLALPVQIHGKALRAHPKPQEGRILVESSGGAFTLVVRVEVPLLPYPDGALAGALTPRQVAEKAKKSPREAAPLFENGEVARWYESNGWTYPVQGPAASGMAAVQQFFEALGLAKPPRVVLNQSVVSLTAPGRQRRIVPLPRIAGEPACLCARAKRNAVAADRQGTQPGEHRPHPPPRAHRSFAAGRDAARQGDSHRQRQPAASPSRSPSPSTAQRSRRWR